jgi:long-chain acyl-CoA synthetase
VENVYARCKYVAESFLYGDSLKNYSVAIIHPNLEHLPVLAQSLGIQEKDVKKLCENKKIT